MNAAMLKMFLKSAGAPPKVMEIFELLESQQLKNPQIAPMAPDDPAWARFPATEQYPQRHGFWVRTEGTNSRMTAAIFIEGDNDATIPNDLLPPGSGK